MDRIEQIRQQHHFFGVGIRKNPKGYPGFPKEKWLFPCFIFLEYKDSSELCECPDRAKDWMIKDKGSIIVLTSKKKYSLSRREVSHIYGPFKFNQNRYIEIEEAVKMLNVSEALLRANFDVINSRIYSVHLQRKFGPLSIYPKNESDFKKIIVKDIYRYHSGYGWVGTTSYRVDLPYEEKEEEEILRKLTSRK